MKSILALSLSLAAGIAAAADFAADFDTVNNPSASGWSYGWTNTLGAFTLSTGTYSDANIHIWGGFAAPDGNPSAYKRFLGDAHGVLQGEAALHGGPNGEISVARYTVPATNIYDVSAIFGAGDIGDVDLYVLRNGTPLFTSLAQGGTVGYGALALPLVAGDTLDFAVGTAGSFFYDSTPLNATITAVPEPASIAVLGLGLAAFRKRRKA